MIWMGGFCMSKSNYTWFPGIPGGVASYYANFILYGSSLFTMDNLCIT